MLEAKLEWMKKELANDELDVTEETIREILTGENLENHEPVIVDYILELDDEWATEGNE